MTTTPPTGNHHEIGEGWIALLLPWLLYEASQACCHAILHCAPRIVCEFGTGKQKKAIIPKESGMGGLPDMIEHLVHDRVGASAPPCLPNPTQHLDQPMR